MSLTDEILKRLRLTATFRWGTVTGLSPLMVQLDGDTAPLAPSDTLVDPAGLVVGDRVRCELSMLRLVVHGKAGGARAAAGKVGLSGMTTGVVASQAVTFPAGLFAAAPTVTVACESTVPGNVRASVSGVSTGGFTVYGVRSDSGTTLGVYWHAGVKS